MLPCNILINCTFMQLSCLLVQVIMGGYRLQKADVCALFIATVEDDFAEQILG